MQSCVKKIRLYGGRGHGLEAQVSAELDTIKFVYVENTQAAPANPENLKPWTEFNTQVYRDTHERDGEFAVFRP